jgi:hypothetical protein
MVKKCLQFKIIEYNNCIMRLCETALVFILILKNRNRRMRIQNILYVLNKSWFLDIKTAPNATIWTD